MDGRASKARMLTERARSRGQAHLDTCQVLTLSPVSHEGKVGPARAESATETHSL